MSREQPAAEFLIEELAARTGMTVRSLRAYQSRRLLPPPAVRARTGYYTERHVARVELIKELQAEGLKLDTIGRMLNRTGDSDAEILRFSHTVKSLFGDEEPQIVTAQELASGFNIGLGAGNLLGRAEKLGIIRHLDDDRFEALSPRLLAAGQAVLTAFDVDAKAALRLVEELRKHADGVAKLYLDLFMKRIWKPFADADQPDQDWPDVLESLQRLRPLAEEALLAVFGLVMSERIDALVARELPRALQAQQYRTQKSSDVKDVGTCSPDPHS
jgi:DNA-binding transcriptional MerR regulator